MEKKTFLCLIDAGLPTLTLQVLNVGAKLPQPTSEGQAPHLHSHSNNKMLMTCFLLHLGLQDTCASTRTRPEVDSCTITLLSSGPLRSCPREEGQNSHIHMEQPLTHSQSARERVCECVWAQLEAAAQHFAYVWKRAHQRRGPQPGPTWVYLLIISVLPCSFRCS